MKQKNVILMVVAVGCGLVAAFLTSQMSGKTVDQVEVVVASRDLAVGTTLTAEDLQGAVKVVKRPKEGLSPTSVFNPDDLVGKQFARPIRADEAINSQDLRKGSFITLPDGYDMSSLQIGAANSAAGFVGPGSRVNVNATLRLGTELKAFPLLVNMLVVAVDTNIAYTKESNGTFPGMNTVSFAVKEKEALLLSLAKSRGCSIELLLRHPNKNTEGDKKYNIDDVIKLLSDENGKDKADIKGAVGGGNGEDKRPNTPVTTTPPVTVTPPVAVLSPPAIPMVKVFVAKKDIAANTELTKDLIAEAFEEKAMPKEYAGNALGDIKDALGQFFKSGISKDQWATPNMFGLQDSKTPPPREFYEPKPPVAEPKSVDPVVAPPVVKKKTLDVTIITANGATVIRYEEDGPGKWKKIAELTPEQAAREDKPDAPKAAPETKKID